MAGLDPIALDAAAAADAALNLGFPIEVLQAQIALGDLLAATILPPQNGTDALEIFGERIAARLPPGVHPGQTLVLQVTGFRGSQILVRNLGIADPRNPVAYASAPVPPAAARESQSAVLTVIRPGAPPSPVENSPPANVPQPRAADTLPIAPPRSVFVAASVRASETPPAPVPRGSAAPLRATPVDARIAAAGAAKAAPAGPRARAAGAAPAPARAPAVSSAPARIETATSRAARTVGDLLRSAGLRDDPVTRTAAAIAPQAPARLPAVLQRLESALAQESPDPRTATVRTLASFIARLNLSNPETLPAQISAYVSHAVEGAEAKLRQMLGAYAQASEAPVPVASPDLAASASRGPASVAPGAVAHPPEATAAVPAAHSVADARAAERAAAVDHDLKTLVLSLLRNPPPGREQTLSQALSETLITLTGTQLNTLAANLQDPGSIAIALPAFFYEGGKPAYLRVSRDGSSPVKRLDAENFHVAFVLDTRNLGTVAIDLQTSARAVKIDVKTENGAAASHFARTLDGLRSRLETLKYRVASAQAAILRSVEAPAAGPAPAVSGGSAVDAQA